jgi:AcrR family transcriptional regulator
MESSGVEGAARMSASTEEAILSAAAALLEARGPDGLTTRAVCEAAGVKAPTLYHHFGDKDGLAAAVVKRGLAEFMRRKRLPPAALDLVDQLRAGWDTAVEFALRHPALFALMGEQARHHPELLAEPYALMRARVQRLVDMGRFRGPVDDAARAIWAASNGVLSLIPQGVPRGEVEQVSDLLFRAVVAELSAPR